MQNYNIGYLLVLEKEESFIGGIMVTDSKGLPIEFKYSEPIKPNKIQKVIYGKVLNNYLKEELITNNLIKETNSTPSLIIINEPSFIKGKEKIVKFPAICVQKTNLPQMKTPGEIQRIKDVEIVFQPFQELNPLRIIFGSPDPDFQERMMFIIKEVSRNMDIYEPVDRIEKAIDIIWKEKK